MNCWAAGEGLSRRSFDQIRTGALRGKIIKRRTRRYTCQNERLRMNSNPMCRNKDAGSRIERRDFG